MPFKYKKRENRKFRKIMRKMGFAAQPNFPNCNELNTDNIEDNLFDNQQSFSEREIKIEDHMGDNQQFFSEREMKIEDELSYNNQRSFSERPIKLEGDLDYNQPFSEREIKIEDELGGNRQSSSEGIEEHSSEITIKNTSTGVFPNLVILFTNYAKNNFNPYKPIGGIELINRCLKQFNYGPLSKEVSGSGSKYYVNVSYEGKVLARGEGPSKVEATLAAGANLTQMLRTTNYAIQPKSSYFKMKKTPIHIWHAKPEDSHIYKVVCFKDKSSGPPPSKDGFTGLVDYVTSDTELWQYVEKHVKSGSYADLYVLNVNTTPFYRRVNAAFGQEGIVGRRLLGSSNRAIVISRNENVHKIFEDLKKSGGENIKYKLIPPGGKLEENKHSNDGVNAGGNGESEEDAEEESEKCQDMPKDMEQQIEIPQWIAENLILMDFFCPNGSFEKPYHQIRLSVLNCPELEEFITENKLDINTSLYTCKAFIDRQLVGIGRSYKKNKAQGIAVDNAFQNLRECCISIQVKESYIGCDPRFLSEDNSPGKNEIFRVVHPREATSEPEFGRVLKQFQNSKLQDLYFFGEFSNQDRELVISMAKDMQLQSRLVGKRGVCVYKRRRPKVIYEELLKTGGRSIKYKLLVPQRQSNKFTLESTAVKQSQYMNKESKIKNLFDINKSNIDLDQHKQSVSNQVKSDSRQTMSSREFKGNQFDNKRFERNKKSYTEGTTTWGEMMPSCSQSSFSGRRPEEQRYDFYNSQEGSHSRNDKRSYSEGPGFMEERLSSYSQPSYSNQRRLDRSHDFNEGSGRLLNQPYNADDKDRRLFQKQNQTYHPEEKYDSLFQRRKYSSSTSDDRYGSGSSNNLYERSQFDRQTHVKQQFQRF